MVDAILYSKVNNANVKMNDRRLDNIIGPAIAKNIALETVFFAAENFILMVAFVVTLISLYSIIKHQRFHPNLRILFINQFVANLCFIIIRAILLIDVFSMRKFLAANTALLLSNTRSGLLEFFTVNLLMILLERSHSTLKAAKYENFFDFRQSMVLTMWPWFVTILIILCLQIEYIDDLLIVSIIFFFDIFSLFSFACLWYFNKRKLQEYSLGTTLSYRFQVQENISTMQFLAVLCVTYSIYLILSLVPTYIFVMETSKAENGFQIIFWSGIFDNITAINCLLSSLIFVLPFKRLLKCRSSKVLLTNVADVQREIYFDQLRKQWT